VHSLGADSDYSGFADKSAQLKAALKVLADIEKKKEKALVFKEVY